MSCAKPAEPIEMSFGLWTQVGPVNHYLGVGIPQVKGGNFRGTFRPIVKYTDIRREPKLFARWQHRCGRSLSLLWQLVPTVWF